MAVTAAAYPRGATEATTRSFNHSRAVFGAVVALVGAAVVLFLYVRGQPQTVEVLKAARDLPPGTVLQSDDLVAETEPLSDGLSALVVPAGERDAVVGRPLGDGLRRGMPLARAQLLDQAQRIPDNLRVVALAVTPEIAAGGQIVPGNEVEILVTTGKTNPGQAHTNAVVDRVTVYATGRQASPGAFASADRSSGAGKPLSWLSVLADAEQARAIATARVTGDLEVNLLPPLRNAGGPSPSPRNTQR